MTPVLSIVVPTRNRQEYARSCLRSLLSIAEPDLEIVVQDNGDDASLGEWLARDCGDPRVRYAHVAGPLTVRENFSAALANASGEYVAMIGDDDTVNPEIVRAARWARAHDVDALTPRNSSVYYWPDVAHPHRTAADSGTLLVREFTGRVAEMDVEAGLLAATRGAFQGLVDALTLPKLYYGLVRRRCLERLRAETGTYFPGVSPDMAAAIGVSRWVERLVSIDYPLFLPGTSARSAAGASAEKRHVGRLEDQPHLVGSDFATWWPKSVPMLYLVQTVWAQAGVSALSATGREDLLRREFDVGLLHAACAVLNRGMWKATMRGYGSALRTVGRSRARGAYDLASGIVRVWGWRARALAGRLQRSRRSRGLEVVGGVETIDQAAVALRRVLAARGQAVDAILPTRLREPGAR